MKMIGHTSSGKPVYAAYQLHRGFSDWSVNDHHDAADLHRKAARSDIKTNVSMHENSAALHEEAAQQIIALVQKLGLAPRTGAGKKPPRQHSTRATRSKISPKETLARIERAAYQSMRDSPEAYPPGALAGVSKKTAARLDREIAEVLAKRTSGTSGTSGQSRATRKASPRPTPYRIKLTPAEMRAVEFAQGRYSWPDMLSAHAAEDGSIAFTESEMWQWTDDVDSDAEGGHSPFPLASDAFAAKLQRFYDERV